MRSHKNILAKKLFLVLIFQLLRENIRTSWFRWFCSTNQRRQAKTIKRGIWYNGEKSRYTLPFRLEICRFYLLDKIVSTILALGYSITLHVDEKRKCDPFHRNDLFSPITHLISFFDFLVVRLILNLQLFEINQMQPLSQFFLWYQTIALSTYWQWFLLYFLYTYISNVILIARNDHGVHLPNATFWTVWDSPAQLRRLRFNLSPYFWVRSGQFSQAWRHTPEQRVAASTLRRHSFGLRLTIAQADARPARPASFR